MSACISTQNWWLNDLVIWCHGLYHLQFVWLDDQPLTKNTPYGFLGQLMTGSIRGFLRACFESFSDSIDIRISYTWPPCAPSFTHRTSLFELTVPTVDVLLIKTCAEMPLWWNLSLLTPTHSTPSAGHSPFCHTSAPDGTAGKQQARAKCEWNFESFPIHWCVLLSQIVTLYWIRLVLFIIDLFCHSVKGTPNKFSRKNDQAERAGKIVKCKILISYWSLYVMVYNKTYWLIHGFSLCDAVMPPKFSR
jgi:hypothetical protein